MFAVNGTPVANLTTNAATRGFQPGLFICSCYGPDTLRFTQITATQAAAA